MRHYLLDASALVDFVFTTREPKAVRVRAEVRKLFKQHNQREARLYVPNVCLAECSKAFARAAYESYPEETADDVYRRHVDTLLAEVSSRHRGAIQSLPVGREHLINIEDVFRLEYRIPVRDRAGHLSGVDAIVIAMGRALARQFGDERVVLVTAEKWMAEVCGRNRPALPAAVYAAERPVPDA